MGTNTQEAVLSAYITSVGKRTPREAAQDAAELCRLSDLADSSHELERSSRNPLAVTGGMPLCISLRAERLYHIDARGACRRQPRRDDCGGQQHERREDHRQDARHLQVWEIAARQTR